MSAKQPSSIPFGENWANFLRRKDDARRLVFLETFLKMAEGWTPGSDATDEEWDDYYMMQPLMSAHLNGKQGGRPKSEAPSETPSETPSKTTPKTVRREKKEGIEGSTTRAGARGKQPPTIEQFKAMAVKAGVPEDFAVYLHAELESVGWTTANGSCVENPIRYLKSAWNAEQKKIRAARVSGDDAFGGIGIAR